VDHHKHLTLENILRIVSAVYGIPPENIRTNRKEKVVTAPRNAFYYSARACMGGDKKPMWSLPKIAAYMGRHHTTLLRSILRYAKTCEECPLTRARAHRIRVQVAQLVLPAPTTTLVELRRRRNQINETAL
jgi:chromosomal replication initiation ATPase DnaA